MLMDLIINSIREIEELKDGWDLGERGPRGIPKCNTCLRCKVQLFRFLSNFLYQCHTQRVQRRGEQLVVQQIVVYTKGRFFPKVRCIFLIVQKMCQKNYPEQEIWQFTGKFFVILK